MPPITDMLRSFGNHGALTNARTVLDQRAGDDWLVASLALRLDEREQAGLAVTARAGAADAA